MKSIQKYLVVFTCLLSSVSFSQRSKEGVVTINAANKIVNEYTTLTANAAAGATTLTVAASSLNANARFSGNLAAGDLIMIIQMQGISVNADSVHFSGSVYGFPNDNTWGEITSYNNCGNYEFCEVKDVPNATSIKIDCGLQHDYTSSGRVQIIRVPRYNTLTITAPGTITCPAWASAGFTGGVVAVEVFGNTIINNANGITATALGFRGGSIAGDNISGLGGGQVSRTDKAEGAEKGEGVYGFQADYDFLGGRYCRGVAGNGGGGGDCHNAAGGGGANAGDIFAWDGEGNPDVSGGAGWVNAWKQESVTFPTHTSSGGGRGGYSFAANDRDATTEGPKPFQTGGTNNWLGDYRENNGGWGGRPLDYSTGKIFLGGGGGAGDQDNNQAGSGAKGGGLIYIMGYGTVSGTGSVVSNGGTGTDSGIDGAGGGGAGGTVIINAVGTISGISIAANGGAGGNQVIPAFTTVQSEGPGGGGGGGYVAISNGAIAQTAAAGANGTTDSPHLTEFPPNGATRGGAGLINQPITNFTIAASANPNPICSGNTSTLTATLSGTVPAGTTITWWDTQVGGSVLATGSSFTTPVLNTTTTYYVGTCPGTYRIAVAVTVTTGPTITVNSPTICSGQTASLTANGGTTYSWSAGATSTGTNTANASPASTTSYTVTGTTSGCSATAVSTVTVNQPAVATFSYTGSPYCKNAANPSPTFSGGGVAGTFTSAAGLSINAGTGVVNLSASTAGTYTVTNTIPASAPCPAVTATATITITTPQTAAFSYTASPYCQNAANPSPTFSGGGVAGTFTSAGGLSINAGTGIVNLSASTPGTYTVTNTIAATGGCPVVTATSSITITAPSVATFSYTASPYCQNSANPSPTFSGGGVAGTFTSTAGLSINSVTGIVNLSTSTPGTYTVTNTIAAAGGCPIVTATSNITITAPKVATFSYTASPYCQDAANPSPTFSGGGVAGTFTSAAGLSINAGTGLVNLSASTPGTYTVTNTIAATGGCPVVIATSSITITAPSVATFSYTASPYCQNAANPSPTFSGGGVAGTFTSTAGLSINSGTGIVNLSASTPGTYTVTNTIAATGGCPVVTATSNITITASKLATFSYTASPYCQNAANPSPTFSGGGVAGTFTSAAGLSINAGTGLVNLSASTPGTYTVTNTIAATGGCPVVTATSSITITAPSVATFSYTGSPYCQNTANPSPTFSGSGVAGTFTSAAGLSINSATGVIDLAASTTGTYTITNTIAASGGCPAITAIANITINPLQNAGFNYSSSTFCQSGTNPTPTITGTGSGVFTSSPAGLSFVNTGTGEINLTSSTLNTYTITYTTPGPCVNTSTATITITNAPVATFSYTASPYCQNAADPSPTFSGGGTAGTFTSTAGLIINGATGVVDLSASTPGTYTVTNTIAASGGCAAATATASITITPGSVTAFSYSGSPYCHSAANPSPTFSSGGVAGTFTSTAGLSLNASTGVVNLSASTVGTYTVVNTISGSCGTADSTIITINTIPDATITQPSSLCVSASPITLTAANPGGTWSGTGITNGTTGTYDPSIGGLGTDTITYTLSGSCPSTDTVVIMVNATSNSTITQPSTVCVASLPFNLTAATAGGNWTGTGITDPVNGTFDPSIAGVGTDTIKYTISGACGSMDTVIVKVTSTSDATITQPASVCSGAAPFNLTAATPGGTWTGTGITNSAAGTFSPSTAGVGTDTITYTISGSCGSVDTVVITINTISNATITQPSSVCVGSAPFNLTAATPGGTWTGTGITDAVNGTFNPSIAGAGNDTITYSISGTCGSTDTVVVTINPPANATINSVLPVCENSAPFNLSAASPGGTWIGTGITNSATGTFDPSASGSGTFTITYTISGACGSSDTQPVTVNASPTPGFTANITSGCAPLCVRFNETVSTTCNTLSYNFGDGNSSSTSSPLHCFTQGGSYSISITCNDANNCSGTTTISNMITVAPTPVANFNISPSGIVGTNTSVTFTDASTAGGNHTWNFGDPLSANNTSSLSNDSHSYVLEGDYCIQLISSNTSGCADTTSQCIIVANDASISIPNVFTPNSDGNNDVFYITSTGVKELTLGIYDRWGLKIAELNSANGAWDGKTPGGNIAPDGVYYYILKATSTNEKSIDKQGFLQLLSKK